MSLLKPAFLWISFIGSCYILSAQPCTKDCYAAIRQAERLLKNFHPDEALEKFHAAMQMANVLQNDSLFSVALFGAGQARWYKSDFRGAATDIQAALSQFQQRKDQYNTGGALRILSNIYDDQGDYEKAFQTIQQALEFYKGYQDTANKVLSLVQIGTLYKNINDYEAAMGFYKKAIAEKPLEGDYPYRELHHRLGELYVAKEQIDSARYFYREALTGNPGSKIIRLRLAESYLIQQDADKALSYLAPLYKEAKSTADIMITIATSLGLAKMHLLRNDAAAALPMALESLHLSAQRGQRQGKRDAYALLSAIYEARNDNKKALQYQKLFQTLKDSLISDQFRGQLYSFKQKAAESEELFSLQNQKRLTERNLAFIILATLFILGLILLRHKNEKLHLRQKAATLEMQALRAQMNPHFIFNCLTAINHFILNNETDKASDYLTRFSRLLRMVLINAGKTTVSLEEELTMLRLYLNMEQLRFKDAFDYGIDIDSQLQPALATVPSFLLQPFCENAIWHGLLHKEGKGRLDIYCYLEEGNLVCRIDDNGIGRKNAASRKKRPVEKGPAFGHKLSAERLNLYNGNLVQVSIFIRDLTPENDKATGTSVTLTIKQPAM